VRRRKPLLRVLIATWGLLLFGAFQADSWAAAIARWDWSKISLGDTLEGAVFFAYMFFLYAGVVPWLIDKSPLARRHAHGRLEA
jgi:hypothetical protein